MQPLTTPANPFALMIDPQAVFERIERSERLDRLQRRICRPLDKPLIPVGANGDEAEIDGDEATAENIDEVVDAVRADGSAI